MVACWLAATKAGAVVINTMPMLRAGELVKIVDKAQVRLALCDTRLMADMVEAQNRSDVLDTVIGFDGSANHDAELDRAALDKPVRFDCVRTGRDDVALLGFTSGTTGAPKATMHFHRDLLIIADAYAREVLDVQPGDVFVGSPPLAFTFGLGGLAVFPLRFGATACLLENASPPNMVEIIQKYRATVCFTAPTAYRAMLNAMDEGADLGSLRAAVSAGETLPAPVYDDWQRKTGRPMLDGIGSTEMLHIFITNRFDDHHPGSTGRPVGGYQARVVDDAGNDVPPGTIGRLAVRGPVGCRYLDDIEKQQSYVQDGWNLTGDVFTQDAEGRFHFAARTDGIILSSGYNIAGPEVEAALLSHPAIAECAVVGAPDPDRGEIVQAHVVLKPGHEACDMLARDIQDHVKATIAPFKYPRRVIFTETLPKTEIRQDPTLSPEGACVMPERISSCPMGYAGDEADAPGYDGDGVPRRYDPAAEGAQMGFAGRMSYGDYLHLDQVLSAQHPLSDAHDEMLFVIQHQTSELWMKLALHELGAARREIAADRLRPAFKMLTRVARIFEQLNNAWDVLRTMTPTEYQSFRGSLAESSGFQSWQYRLIEYAVGNRNAALLRPHAHRPDLVEMLQAELAQPSLYDVVQTAAARRGLSIPADILNRDTAQAWVADARVEAAWAEVYRDPTQHWELYELAEKLVDFEDYFRRWRFNHVTTVERIIGFKRGTGGTGGVSYLKKMLETELFPELWSLRTGL